MQGHNRQVRFRLSINFLEINRRGISAPPKSLINRAVWSEPVWDKSNQGP